MRVVYAECMNGNLLISGTGKVMSLRFEKHKKYFLVLNQTIVPSSKYCIAVTKWVENIQVEYE